MLFVFPMNSKKEFVEIIKENEGLIYKVSKVFTNTKEDQQDLYQEIVYQLWKCFSYFRKPQFNWKTF